MGVSPKVVTKRSILAKKKPPEQVTIINAVCSSGGTCAQITASPTASACLASLKTASGNLGAALTTRDALALEYKAACQTVTQCTVVLGKATSTYFGAVDTVAAGDAAIIAAAGGTPRSGHTLAATLIGVSNLRSSLGKLSAESIIQWAAAPGASSYRLRVNFAPTATPAVWIELSPGRSRRRVVTAPAPAAQFLVSVAAVGANASTDWSAPILATAR